VNILRIIRPRKYLHNDIGGPVTPSSVRPESVVGRRGKGHAQWPDGGREESGRWSCKAGYDGIRRLSVSDLPVGTNPITLEALNSHGLSGTTSITVIVVDELTNTIPTLVVDPPTIGLHAAADATAEEHGEIRIGNAGGGTLTFTATTDGASWLSLEGQPSVRVAPRGLSAYGPTRPDLPRA
jgi:hypothetical protein